MFVCFPLAVQASSVFLISSVCALNAPATRFPWICVQLYWWKFCGKIRSRWRKSENFWHNLTYTVYAVQTCQPMIGVKSVARDHISVSRPIPKQNDFDLSFLRKDERRQDTVKLMNRSRIEFIVCLPILHLSQLCDFGARQVLRRIHAIKRLSSSSSSSCVLIQACDMWFRFWDKYVTEWNIDVNARPSNN